MKKIAIAVVALLCVAASENLITMSSPVSEAQPKCLVANAEDAYEDSSEEEWEDYTEETPEFLPEDVDVRADWWDAYTYSYDYADTTFYSTTISKITKKWKDENGKDQPIPDWTDDAGNKYGIYTVKITHKEYTYNDEGKVTRTEVITDEEFNRIALIKAKNTIHDFTFHDSLPDNVIAACEAAGVEMDGIGTRATVIADSAFYETSSTDPSYLKSIDLSGIEYIGNRAFSKCAYITELSIPECVKYLGTNVFDGSGLKTLHVQNEMPIIPNYLCSNTKLTDIDFAYPKMIFSVGEGAFKNTPVAYPIFNDWKTAEGYARLTVGKSAYEGCTSLQSVIMSDNVVGLSISAFKGCTSLSTIEFGTNTRYADKECFYGCTSLASIKFNEKLGGLGGGVFANCTSLKQVSGIPDTIKDWEKSEDDPNTGWGFGDSMFAGCTSLISAQLPGSLTKIPSRTFSGCISLIEVPNTNDEYRYNIVEIESEAFKNCKHLLSAEYPWVEKVGASAFENCETLKEISYDYASNIGQYAFKNCSELTSFVSGYCKGEFDEKGNRKSYGVGKNAFEGCSSLESIELLSDSYDEYVFKNCTKAQTITIDCENMQKTPKGMFSGCSLLTDVKSKNEQGVYGTFECITIVAPETFAKCESLQNINLSSLRIIETSAFADCTSLKSVCLGDIEAEDYGSKCFYNCKELTSAVKGNISTIGESSFQYSGITSVDINGMIGGTFVIGNNAFANCPNLKKANINSNDDVVFDVKNAIFKQSDQLKEVVYAGPIITERMFDGCKSLTSLKTKADIVKNYAFNDCEKLNKIVNYEGKDLIAKEIGSYAFKNCASITKSYSDINTTFDEKSSNQYENCKSLKSITVNMVTKGMCLNCESLTNVKLHEVIHIPDQAFKNCTSLEKFDFSPIVTVGANSFENTGFKEVKFDVADSIGRNAFANCTKLVFADISSDKVEAYAFANNAALERVELFVTSVGDNAFYNCEKLYDVDFFVTEGREIKTIGSNAFGNCESLPCILVPGNPTINNKAIGFTKKGLNLDFVIIGDLGSTVEDYATVNDILFQDAATYDENAPLITRPVTTPTVPVSTTTTTTTTVPTTTAPSGSGNTPGSTNPSGSGTEPVPVGNSAKGDVNGDKAVDASDASLVLVEYAMRQTGKPSSLSDAQRMAADVNGDGIVDASDASSILAYYAYVSTGGSDNIDTWIKKNKK